MPPRNAKVRIITSFGGRGPTGVPLSDPEERGASERRAALAYTAVKEIIKHHGGGRFDVDRCITHYGPIAPTVLDEIAEADVVVAILDRINPTVVFELAFRHTLRGQVVLVVTDQRAIQEAIPFYLKDWAFVQFTQAFCEILSSQANDTKGFPDLTFEDCEISPGLRAEISVESGWGHDLCEAIDDALVSQPKPSPYFDSVVLPRLANHSESFQLEPWGRASNYPLSILKVDFSRMSYPNEGRYDHTDVVGGPLIFDANRGFAKIFNITFRDSETIFSQLQRKTLNFTKLMDRLTGANGKMRLSHEDWDVNKFAKDQERLTELVVFRDAEAADWDAPRPSEKDLYAKEPIRLADDHPVEEMRGECFLPCLIAKRRSGEFPMGQHSAYFEIAYIDVTQLAGVAAPLKGAPMA